MVLEDRQQAIGLVSADQSGGGAGVAVPRCAGFIYRALVLTRGAGVARVRGVRPAAHLWRVTYLEDSRRTDLGY
jgi:hypothetical protein